MQFQFNQDEPLYRQIALQIEEGIFTGSFPAGAQIPSTTEFSHQFGINPATVLKGMNQLVTAGLIEKKRGLGMFVVENAKQTITEQRRQAFFKNYVQALIIEAQKLDLSQPALIALIERGYQDGDTQNTRTD